MTERFGPSSLSRLLFVLCFWCRNATFTCMKQTSRAAELDRFYLKLHGKAVGIRSTKAVAINIQAISAAIIRLPPAPLRGMAGAGLLGLATCMYCS